MSASRSRTALSCTSAHSCGPTLLCASRYPQSVMVATVGVHALDLNGCLPPQDHVPSAAEEAAWAAAGICRPRWWVLPLLPLPVVTVAAIDGALALTCPTQKECPAPPHPTAAAQAVV